MGRCWLASRAGAGHSVPMAAVMPCPVTTCSFAWRRSEGGEGLVAHRRTWRWCAARLIGGGCLVSLPYCLPDCLPIFA